MVNLSRIGIKVEKGARKFVSGMNRENVYAPIILLEGAVVAGRTYQAYKRGGFIEARERVTEESLGSIFWLGGVAMFGAMIDVIGKKVFNIKTTEGSSNQKKNIFSKIRNSIETMKFDVGKDHARNSFKNFVSKIVKDSNKPMNVEKLEKGLAAFKFTKIIASILLANTFMGFIVPRFNQKITKNIQKTKKDASLNTPQIAQTPQRVSIEDFLAKKDKNISFQGFGSLNAAKLLSLSNTFETDARVKLLSTDVGTVSGRGINARNKNERIEVLFRDISSMYFYYLCKTHVNSLLNLMQIGKKDRLDPVSAKQFDSYLRKNFNANGYNAKEFKKHVLGNDIKIPETVQTKLQVPEETINEIKKKYKDTTKAEAQIKAQSKIMTLEEFKNIVGNDTKLAKIAEKMSKLQPELSTGAILTESQVKDIFNHEALINDPRFLNKMFRKFTGGDSTNPVKFVAEKDLVELKERMVDYVESIVTKAKGQNITLETLTKANKANFAKNALNLGAGFAVSAMFLSTFIPKIQYMITKKLTGQDSFPGVQPQQK